MHTARVIGLSLILRPVNFKVKFAGTRPIWLLLDLFASKYQIGQ
jgi:hypothetical protein